jgi:probable phosphoglycerate mutase
VIELVFVRHAQPDWEPDGRAVDEPSLTPLGRQQAERVAEVLSQERVDALYTSTMRRALETAEPIAVRLGIEARAESWICELGLPSLEGKPLEEVAEFFSRSRARDLEAWWSESIAGGESFRHFHERVTSGVLGLEPVPWAHERMSLGWAGIVRLRTRPIASGAIWSMCAFNSRRHLHGLPDPEG